MNAVDLPFSPLTLTFPEGIDSTMLTTFECPQKFFQEFCIRKTPTGRSIDLHAGGAMARAFELIRRYHYKFGKTLQEALELTYPQFVRQWGWFDPKPGNYKDFYNCWCAVEAYFNEYPLETDFFQPLMLQNGEPAVEFQFAIPLEGLIHPITGNPIVFAGRSDMLAINSMYPNVCYTVDEKTTKGIGPQWPYQWDMRGQFYGYTWASRKLGHRCAGALVRGIAIQQTQYAFAEKVIFYTEWQIENWERYMRNKVQRMIYMFELSLEVLQPALSRGWEPEEIMRQLHNKWDQSFGEMCTSYGGCQFVDLCTKEAPWDFYYDYETRIWNPLHQDPTDESAARAYEEIPLSQLMAGFES